MPELGPQGQFFPELYDVTKHPEVRGMLFDLRSRRNLLAFGECSDSTRISIGDMIRDEETMLNILTRELSQDQLDLVRDIHQSGTQIFQSSVRFRPEYPSEE